MQFSNWSLERRYDLARGYFPPAFGNVTGLFEIDACGGCIGPGGNGLWIAVFGLPAENAVTLATGNLQPLMGIPKRFRSDDPPAPPEYIQRTSANGCEVVTRGEIEGWGGAATPETVRMVNDVGCEVGGFHSEVRDDTWVFIAPRMQKIV